MTGYNAYAIESDGSKNMNVLGLGYVGGLCTKFFVALGEDVAGTYSGMHTLTHEGGHVLGASHDQSNPKPSIPGDPGSLKCPWKDGHIMSYVDGGPRHHSFFMVQSEANTASRAIARRSLLESEHRQHWAHGTGEVSRYGRSTKRILQKCFSERTKRDR
uniref:Putative zinc-dependent metalloprotease n=1 Tax=Rhipicephalus microplus TaxID=6941 RepID=A0A6G5A2R1_RHIMP